MQFERWRLQGRAVVVVCALLLVSAVPADVQGLHLDWRDDQASPAESFYAYANGGWQARNPIPPAYSRWGTFDVLHRHTQEVIRGILERAAADHEAAPGSVTQKIGDFYVSGMDEAAADRAGVTPLQDELAAIDGIQGSDDLQAAIARVQLIGVDAAFSFGHMPDPVDSQRGIGVAMQGGLGLPDRTYYLDPGLAAVRAAYVAHVARTLQLLGDAESDARDAAAAIMDLETTLAKASLSKAQLRNPRALHHPMNRAALDRLTPHFSWGDFFAAVGRPDLQHINVATPAFFDALDAELATTPIATFRAYLRWRLGATFAPYLSKPFQDESFAMRKVLTGAQAIPARWLRVLDAEDAALGFAVGQRYVEEVFPPSAKESAAALLHRIHDALASDLATLSWMGPTTRAAALEKLGQMGERIGYPDRFRDYAGLEIDRGAWATNVLRGKAFDVRREIDQIDQPVDRSEWLMTPQTVNAYYDPSMNVINFPAAILQPPFFDPEAPATADLGGIGWIMGHEMTHGFDDEGAQFDGKGNLRNWWTPEDLARFHALTACIADQFSGFVAGGVHLDGKLVVGEATADLGGLTLAHRALRSGLAGEDEPVLAGLTPDQQFFLAAAHIWASNARPEEERLRATTDPHPPPRYRVDGTFANMPAFQEAFAIPDGSPMVRTDRCAIW
jgi:putative endopeptidase